VGGQGLILAGMILGEAATIYAGLNAVQTQSYAPLVRGAPSMSEVIISDAEIDFPVVEEADVLLALVQDSFDEHASKVRPGGLIVAADRGVVIPENWDGAAVRQLPLAQAALDAGAAPIAATMVGCGAILRRIEVVPLEAMAQAVRLRVPREVRDANVRALEAGYALLG